MALHENEVPVDAAVVRWPGSVRNGGLPLTPAGAGTDNTMYLRVRPALAAERLAQLHDLLAECTD